MLTLALAFGDNHYPIPSIPTDHNTSVKTWHDFCKPVFDHSIKNGIVLTNDDYSACLCLTEMGNTAEVDVDDLYNKSKEYMSEECAQNQKDIARFYVLEATVDGIDVTSQIVNNNTKFPKYCINHSN